VDEFGFIERVDGGQFVYHSQRGYAHDPFTMAESSKRTFSNAKEAAHYYLKWPLHLPGDLDGWEVM